MAKPRARRQPPAAAARHRRGGHPPAAAEARHRQALAAYERRDYTAALDHLRGAIALNPGVALWQTHLGAVLRATGALPQAIAAHRRAIALDPRLAVAHNNLGNALRAAGEAEAAEAALRQAVRLAPDYVEALVNLARLLRECGRLGDAEIACRRALELRPDYSGTKGELGALCWSRGDFAGAARWFGAVCEACPADAEAAMALGQALEGLGRFTEADGAYDRAIALAPDHAHAHFVRARRSEQQGDAGAAAFHFRQALVRDPRMANAYLGLATLPGGGLSSEDKKAVGGLLKMPDLPRDERSSLYYALARSAECEQRWDEAFRWARLANELDHARTAFEETENIAFVRQTIAAFAPDYRTRVSAGSDSERPVFIIGMPRSGTTLVEQIITSHPQAAAGGELVDMPVLADRLAAMTGGRHPYPECVFDLDAAQAQDLSEQYLARLDRISPTALRISDKLPFNFRHLGLITALFPKARIIHCRRDPRDIAVSCYFIKFHRPISFACDLFELGAYLRHYQILMAHWRRVLPQMLEVQYEELVTDPEPQIRRLIDFCGLPWDESVLRFHQAARTVRTASVSQVRRPIYESAIGRWQHYGRHLLPLYAELEGRPSLAPRARIGAPVRLPERVGAVSRREHESATGHMP